MELRMTNRGLEVLSTETCEQLLGSRTFGRVVTKIGETLSAFPVYYVFHDGEVVFRTDPGTKLAAAVLRTMVTFEIDAALALLDDHWPENERLRAVTIRVEHISGRRLRRGVRASEGGVAS
jgi:nitroimidazol reductase NimA-like FMN-containing flavoprotein (pyridoxamine 5'-phosphate oxidase superfamily)